MKRLFLSLLLAALAALPAIAQSTNSDQPSGEQRPEDIRELKLKDWEPRAMLKAKATIVERPKFPVIDVHNHLGGGKQTLTSERVLSYLEEMKAAGVETVVNLDGGWGDRLKETLAALDNRYPDRFMTFALINFNGIDDPDWSQREADVLRESFKLGAKGLKFHKSLGLTVRYKDGRLMPVDDPKLDPIWQVCAEFKRPVMIHVADPAAFFTPLDRFNERWHELNEHPDWLFYGDLYPERDEILAARNRMIAKNPQTTFICAHMGNNPENLAQVGEWLDAYPNMYIDIDARISELGRQPYTARRFLIKYQDRIMFGTDTTCRREAYRIYYRFLETDDEYFNCDASHHRQGFWPIYGVFLPDEVLEKIYNKNAERVIFGLHEEAAGGEQAAAEKKKSDPAARDATVTPPTLRVPRVADFELTGDGAAPAWEGVPWTPLLPHGGGPAAGAAASRFKIAYSDRGVYVLMEGPDEQIVATKTQDNDELWHEDCFEAFLWPEESEPVYFEYEVSPRGFELPLLVPNLQGRFRGWLPWQYEGERKVQKAVHIRRPPGAAADAAAGWSAEFMIPFALLKPLKAPPTPGDRWRANFYQVDLTRGETTAWNWAPVGPSFHECQKFGTLVFE